MPNFVDCWNSLKAKGYKHADGSEVLNDQDRASIESRIQEHLRTGLDPIEAAKASVKSHLDEAHAQLQSIYDQVKPPAEVPLTRDTERIATEAKAKLNPSAVARLNTLADKKSMSVGELRDPQKGISAVVQSDPQGAYDYAVAQSQRNLPDDPHYTRNFKKIADHIKNTWPNIQEAQSVSEAGQTPAVTTLPEQKTGVAVAGQPKIEGGTGEEVQKGQEGREAVLATERVQPPAVPVHPTSETASTELNRTGIANRYLEDVYGDAAPVATTGKGAKEWKNIGQGRLDNFQKTGSIADDPYAVLTNLREGKVPMKQVASDVSLLRAEHQRLVEDARNSEGTPEWTSKSQAALDMANSIKSVAHGPASDVFRSLQEHDQPRYDNLTDFDQAVRERMGRESTPEEKAQFNRIVNDVKRTRAAADNEVDMAQRKVQQYRSKSKLSFDDATKSIHDQITELTKLCNL